MLKKHALFISIFFTLLIAGNYLFINAEKIFPEREKVFIVRVLDGDTVELDTGFKVRLVNINTPEKGHFGSDEATAFLKEFENKELEIEKLGTDRYGRILGRLFDSNTYLNLKIVELGLAHKFLVEESELEEFSEKETEARKNELVIWEKSSDAGCLTLEINKKDEFVSIKNGCGNLEGWTVKDESTRGFTFEKNEREEFILWSGKGEETEKDFYWGRGNVWNDDKDAIFIRDKDGLLVFYDSYGYDTS